MGERPLKWDALPFFRLAPVSAHSCFVWTLGAGLCGPGLPRSVWWGGDTGFPGASAEGCQEGQYPACVLGAGEVSRCGKPVGFGPSARGLERLDSCEVSCPPPSLPAGLCRRHWGERSRGSWRRWFLGLPRAPQTPRWPQEEVLPLCWPALSPVPPASVSLSVSSLGAASPCARSPYCLNLSEKPCFGLCYSVRASFCPPSPQRPAVGAPDASGLGSGSRAEPSACTGRLWSRTFRASLQCLARHVQSLGLSPCQMAKATPEGDGLDPRALFVLKESMALSVSPYRAGRCLSAPSTPPTSPCTDTQLLGQWQTGRSSGHVPMASLSGPGPSSPRAVCVGTTRPAPGISMH